SAITLLSSSLPFCWRRVFVLAVERIRSIYWLAMGASKLPFSFSLSSPCTVSLLLRPGWSRFVLVAAADLLLPLLGVLGRDEVIELEVALMKDELAALR